MLLFCFKDKGEIITTNYYLAFFSIDNEVHIIYLDLFRKRRYAS